MLIIEAFFAIFSSISVSCVAPESQKVKNNYFSEKKISMKKIRGVGTLFDPPGYTPGCFNN